jgi:hypothetical protein
VGAEPPEDDPADRAADGPEDEPENELHAGADSDTPAPMGDMVGGDPQVPAPAAEAPIEVLDAVAESTE